MGFGHCSFEKKSAALPMANSVLIVKNQADQKVAGGEIELKPRPIL